MSNLTIVSNITKIRYSKLRDAITQPGGVAFIGIDDSTGASIDLQFHRGDIEPLQHMIEAATKAIIFLTTPKEEHKDD